MRDALWVIVLVGLSVSAGCAGDTAKTTTSYETIARDLRRNTELARSENARAVDLMDEQRWDEAEQALLSALDADVTFGPAHNNLGRVYYQQGKFYLAAWEFQYAIKLMPYQPQPKNNLGLVLEESGRLNEAVQNYDAALAIEPENPEFVGNAARARTRRGDSDQRTYQLLADIAANDARPQWNSWAKERIALWEFAPSTRPSTDGGAP